MIELIEFRQEELPAQKQAYLKTHLSDTGHLLLESVIASKCKTELAKAITPAIDSRDHPLKLDLANAALKDAHRYQTCLDVLEELRTQKEPFTLAKPV